MTVDQSPTHRADAPSPVSAAVRAAAIGNAVEWFDFAIYGFLATYIATKFFLRATTPPRC